MSDTTPDAAPIVQPVQAPDPTTAHSGTSAAPSMLAAGTSALGSRMLHRKLAMRVARKAEGGDGNGVRDDAESAVSQAGSSSGAPLPATLQRKFESSLGTDLSQVRLHTGGPSAAAAESVGARAYAVGHDVHFGEGQYNPSSSDGQHLIAHEVAHTVQQSGAVGRKPQFKLNVSAPGDSSEVAADAAADAMVAGQPAAVSPTAGSVQRDVASSPAAPASTPASTPAGTPATGGGGGATAAATPARPTPGSATVVGAAADTQSAFDNSFTPALVAQLQANPNKSIDEVLQGLASSPLHAFGNGMTNDTGLHHPTIVQYGQTAANTGESRDNKKIAVLVANQNYTHVNPLTTPIAEANTMKGQLTARGYDANVHPDKNSVEMGTLWNSMVGAAQSGDDLMAFYGGHGEPTGLCGINADFPPNPPDTFTNSQVAGVVSSATGKGAHIRFVMDSCHSGSAAQTVREERANELAAHRSSLSDVLRVAALEGLRRAKQQLIAHTNKRAQTLDPLDQAIAQQQAQVATNPQAAAVVTALQNVKTVVTTAFDREADRIWGSMVPLLLILKVALGHRAAPPAITDYRTLGAQINYLDTLWNTCSQPMEHAVAEQQAARP